MHRHYSVATFVHINLPKKQIFFYKLGIVLMITNKPPLEQGRQKYIYVIISFLYIQYVSDLFVYLILTDQNKS